MDLDKIKDNYILDIKEREYQEKMFGRFEDDKSLNTASFLIFLKDYINRALEAYTRKWTSEKPEHIITCKEFELHGVGPFKTYDELIKIRALAGVPLELNATIDVKKWRK